MIHFLKLFPPIVSIFKSQKKVCITQGNYQRRYHSTDREEDIPEPEAINFKDAPHRFDKKSFYF